MTTVDALPPDQRAVLQLVLQQGRSYDEIAGMLAIERAAVRQRALDALAALAGARWAEAPEQALVTDYLLGQLPDRVAAQVLLYLESSPLDRAWAAAVRVRLTRLATRRLPELPAGAEPDAEPEVGLQNAEEAEAPLPASDSGLESEAPPPSPPQPVAPTPASAPPPDPDIPPAPPAGPQPAAESQRPGVSQSPARPGARRSPPPRPPRRFPGRNAILAAVVVALVVFVAVLFTTVGSTGPGTGSTAPGTGTQRQASVPQTSSSPVTTPQTATNGTKSTGGPHILATLHLTAPVGTTQATGVAQVVRKGHVTGIVIAAQGLPANTRHNAYAVWLYRPAGRARFVGFVPSLVGKDGRLRTEGTLPSDAAKYSRLLLTLETTAKPSAPGQVILAGPFRVRP